MGDESDAAPEIGVEMVKKYTMLLMEHFDSVQIFCTRFNSAEQNTTKLCLGDGNFYARFGQVSEWIEQEKEQSRINARERNEE